MSELVTVLGPFIAIAVEGATYVIGWLNLFAVAAIGFMGYLFFSASRWHRPWELTMWFLLIFGVMDGIGVWRYRMVAKSLQARDGDNQRA